MVSGILRMSGPSLCFTVTDLPYAVELEPLSQDGLPIADVVLGRVIVGSINEAERVLCVHVLLGVGDSHVPQQYAVHFSTARNDALKEASTKMVLVDPT